MKHFEDGGCLKGQEHNGPCEWTIMPGKTRRAVCPENGVVADVHNGSPNPIKVIDDRERVKAWRRKNPERYRNYMREFMRQKRARAQS